MSSEEAVGVAQHLKPGPVYVKALAPTDSRAAKGGVIRVEDRADVRGAFISVTTALGVDEARVEEAESAVAEWYLALGVMPGQNVPELLFSASGGSGIVDRAELTTRVSIDPFIGLRPFHCRLAASRAGLPYELWPLLEETAVRCYQLMKKFDAILVEINPLGVNGQEIVALDARIIIDDYGLVRHPDLGETRSASRDARTVRGQLRDAGIAYVNLHGKIGVVGLGAGLTMHLADWIVLEGGTPAFFFDATAAAVRSHRVLFQGELAVDFVDALSYGLDLVRNDMEVLLVNFTSGGTPVDGLSRALLVALEKIDWTGPLVVHVGGNRRDEAVRFLRDSGLDAAPSLGDAVRTAVRSVNS